MDRLRILVYILALSLCTVTLVPAQCKEFNIYDAVHIPRSLQQSLVDRLMLFVELQPKGEWDRVADLLGPFSSIGRRRIKYSVAEKQWVIEKLKEKPLRNFIPRSVEFSTDSIDLPLNKRWWYVEGEGELFQSGIKEKVVILPYRNKGEWYFQPMVVISFSWAPLLKPAPNKRLERTRQ